jgi:hypothetical protein
MPRSTTKSNERKGQSHTQKLALSADKKAKKTSYTQGDKMPESIEEVLHELNLKKPKRAYNFYIMEMKESHKLATMIETVEQYSKKWATLNSAQKKKYQDLADEDTQRYNNHLEIVKKFLQQGKPSRQGATTYRIFLDEERRKAIDNNEDLNQSKKEAAEKWKKMTPEEKKAYEDKRKEQVEIYETLRKKTGIVNAYSIFVRDQMSAAKEKNTTTNFKEIAEKWGKTKQTIKDKYAEYAEEENEEREKTRDLYEVAIGVKPRRPHGAFKFFLMECAKSGKLNGKSPLVDGKKLFEKLSTAEKQKYDDMAKKDKLLYQVKKMEYDLSTKKNVSQKAPSPLNLFMADMKGKLDSAEGNFFSQVYKKWNKMDKASKDKYVKLAEEKKKEFEKEQNVNKSHVYDVPKRPPTNFNLYIIDATEELKKKNPKKAATEILSIAAQSWKNLKESDKSDYTAEAEKLKLNYRLHMKQFKKDGFYDKDSVAAPKVEKKETKAKTTKRSVSKARSKSEPKSKKGKTTGAKAK